MTDNGRASEGVQTAVRPADGGGSAGAASLDDPRVHQAMEEYLKLLQAGERPDRQTFLARYPEVASALAECLQGLDFVHAAGAELSHPVASGARSGRGVADARGLAGPLGDFRILREVGRGGMGIVYEAEQISLGRQVALKVLPFAATMDPKQLQRFHNEAKAAAGLHHEHIIPVYFVGCERGVHFYAMQFIDGLTLAQHIQALQPEDGRLAADPAATQDYRAGGAAPTPPVAALSTERSGPRGRAFYRQAAELIAHAADALEYAHSLGIVHRDIKPGNLMMDQAGKLWVGDFGLARLGVDAGLTMSGDLVGTLRYMAPEQALARHGLVDHRADVYALGATLYELLTLRPAVTGSERAEVLRQVAFEEPAAPRKLDKAIPVELETITLKCLTKNPNERYATAGELADDLRRWLEDKAIKAKPPSLRQRMAKWTRRHQAVVASAAVIAVIAAASLGWIVGDRHARRTEAERQVTEALLAAEPLLAQGNPHDPKLIDVARKAEAHLASGMVRPELQRRVERLVADQAMLARLEEIRSEQATVIVTDYHRGKVDSDYAQAFRRYGIDVDALGIEEAAAQIRTRAIAVHLAAALDNRALLRQQNKVTNWKQLLDVAREVDPDTWRCAFREAWASGIEENLDRLLASAPIEKLAPTTLGLLGMIIDEHPKLAPRLVNLLRNGQQLHPDDIWINFSLARILKHYVEPPQFEEAVGFYRAALALRPQSARGHLGLGRAFLRLGRFDEAIVCCQNCLRISEGMWEARVTIGEALFGKGQPDEAIACCREVIRGGPHDAATHNNVGIAFAIMGRSDESIACFREAVRLENDDPTLHANLGNALQSKGQLDEAIASYREAIRLKKDYDNPYNGLGGALHAKGHLDEAIASYREAIRLNKDSAHTNLGTALQAKGELDAAIACFREAIRLDKDSTDAHNGLGEALQAKGQLDEAIACFREAVRLRKDSPGFHSRGHGTTIEEHPIGAHINLGNALHAKGQLDEAMACFRVAIRLGKDRADASDKLNAQGHLAWFLATCPEAQFRDPQQALELAKKLVKASPPWREFWKTLGVAHYRAGDWPAAVVALEKAMSPAKGGNSSEWFFLAMAHAHLGDLYRAGLYYLAAVRWMEKHKPHDPELGRFRAEAAALLGLPEQALQKEKATPPTKD